MNRRELLKQLLATPLLGLLPAEYDYVARIAEVYPAKSWQEPPIMLPTTTMDPADWQYKCKWVWDQEMEMWVIPDGEDT